MDTNVSRGSMKHHLRPIGYNTKHLAGDRVDLYQERRAPGPERAPLGSYRQFNHQD
jgi:hypothetical protein